MTISFKSFKEKLWLILHFWDFEMVMKFISERPKQIFKDTQKEWKYWEQTK